MRSKLNLIVILTATWAVALVTFGDEVAAQRLCEHNDHPVAKIAPCTGVPGTPITVTMVRQLSSPPSTLMFKRVLTSGAPSQVTAPIVNSAVPSPVGLCTTGAGRWEVWLVLANGQSQGKIGAFWPNCSGSPDPPPMPPKPGPSPSQNLKMDPCLVGKWKNVAGVANPPGRPAVDGGVGMTIEINRAGVQTVDYSVMRAIKAGSIDFVFSGNSVGQLTVKDNTAKSTGISNTTKLEMRYDGRPDTAKPSIGPMLGINKNSNVYNCRGNALEFVQEDYRGIPWLKFTLKRQ